MTKERKNRILIVDDTQNIHNDIKKILAPSSNSSDLDALVQEISGLAESESSPLAIEIDSALQGDEGVDMVRQAKLDGNPYALAFVDIRIPPGLDGVQTIKQMQLADSCLQYIIITAYSDYSWEHINAELSPKDNLLIIKKPFETIEIRQSASALLEKWHLSQERNEAIENLIHSKKIEAIGIMANGIAHDFNNLLMGIQGNIELAAMHLPEEHSSREFLKTSTNIVMTTKKLILKFLMFSDMNSPHKQPLLVKDMLTYARSHVFKGKKESCELLTGENVWLVDADPRQMNQVFVEIFNNAKEAMDDDGRLTVKVENSQNSSTTLPDNQKKTYVQIIVHDQGCGIQQEDLPRIYDPYFSTRPRGSKKGMGLGLALVAAIISQHEGKVHIDSVPGEGTTVEIRLPALNQQLPGYSL